MLSLTTFLPFAFLSLSSLASARDSLLTPNPHDSLHSTVPLPNTTTNANHTSHLPVLADGTPYKPLNITVDDTFGDFVSGIVPHYSPPDMWVEGSNCDQCHVRGEKGERPNLAWAVGGTWKETTYFGGWENRTISFKFSGVGVYAYFILPNSLPVGQNVSSSTVNTNLTFVLDNEPAGNLTYIPTETSSVPFLYNQLGFAASNLSNETHTLEIHANAPEHGMSVVLFDHLVFTMALNETTVLPEINAPEQPVPQSVSPSDEL